MNIPSLCCLCLESINNHWDHLSSNIPKKLDDLSKNQLVKTITRDPTASFARLECLKNNDLDKLDLFLIRLQTASVRKIPTLFPNLTDLDLGVIPQVSKEALIDLKSLTKLLTLKMQSNKIDDVTLPQLVTHLQSLTLLNISGCEQITTAGIQPFLAMTQLKELKLVSTQVKRIEEVADFIKQDNQLTGRRVKIFRIVPSAPPEASLNQAFEFGQKNNDFSLLEAVIDSGSFLQFEIENFYFLIASHPELNQTLTSYFSRLILHPQFLINESVRINGDTILHVISEDWIRNSRSDLIKVVMAHPKIDLNKLNLDTKTCLDLLLGAVSEATEFTLTDELVEEFDTIKAFLIDKGAKSASQLLFQSRAEDC